MGKLKWAKAESIKVHAVRGSVWRRVKYWRRVANEAGRIDWASVLDHWGDFVKRFG